MISSAGLRPDDKLFKLFRSGKQMSYKKSEQILPGDTTHVFMIEKGFVRAYTINNRGVQFTHVVFTGYDMFPAFRVFDGDEELFYEALSVTTVYALPRADLVQLVRTDLLASNNLLRITTRQTRILADRVRNLEFRYAPERIIFRLLVMAERFGEERQDGSYYIDAPISQPVIATAVNASRESVSRTMENLKVTGLIDYNSRHLVIHDIKALRDRINISDN